jgi:hypothetical protein
MHFLGDPEQTRLLQSLPVEQNLPSRQVGQVPPPQSVSVSAEFLTVSVQVAAWQTPLVQTLLAQSLAVLQALPVVQALQVPPPQSVSVSAEFLTPSEQVAA